jgi:dipeptidyl aminopeptidase/acylaminoacyl peptidase
MWRLAGWRSQPADATSPLLKKGIVVLDKQATAISTVRDEIAIASQRNVATPETFTTIRQVTDAVISPDGARAAFVVGEWVDEQEKQRKRIWRADLASGEVLPYTSGPIADTSPAWSPDGTLLAFISRSDKSENKPQLYVIPAEGKEPRQLCTMPNGVSFISWSPDGKRIAFLARYGDEPGNDPVVLQPGQGRHQRLWTVRLDSDTPEPVTPDGISIWNYAWSPDCQQFAVYYATGPDETDWYRGQIGVVPAQGGLVRQISRLTRQAWNLSWSPDSKRIAYVSGEWSDPDRGGGEVFVHTLESGKVHNLTPDLDWSITWVAWLPDGQRLLCAGWSGVTCRIALLDETTKQISLLADEHVLGDRFWPHLSTTLDMHRLVAARSVHASPHEIWMADVHFDGANSATLSWKQLSHLNALPQETLIKGRVERIRYAGADKWPIDALVTWPVDHQKNSCPPLIVCVHGGPSGIWLDDNELISQMYAGAGFAVLRANIRGSVGRGAAFADAVLGDMGGKDFQDLMYGINHLVGRGLVDGERVGIAGWSYGGCMTAWAVTQTQRFKAAVMGAGISDFHSFHAQTNIPDWDMRFLGQPPVSPLAHANIYRERSAITYAERVTTPTLIVHGEKDPCVPVNQAYAFYRALQERGIPVELVVYPREGHSLMERKHYQDYLRRALDWFKRYLGA